MPKSTPRPTNSTANATEIRFSAPTIIKPSAAVTAKPTARLRNTARMIRGECSASQRITSTMMMVPMHVDHGAFLQRAELVVRHRHRSGQARCAPGSPSPSLRSAAALRIASLAAWPGCKRGKVQHRHDFDEMAKLARVLGGFPLSSTCQEKLAGCPAITWSIVSDGHGQRALQIFELGLAALHAEQAERQRPRQPAQRRIAGQCADHRAGAAEPLRHARKIVLRLKQQAVFRKERIAVELAHRHETGRAARSASAPAWRSPRWQAPASAHRPPPGSSRTIRGMPSRRRVRVAASRDSGEISLLMSVVMAKCVAA